MSHKQETKACTTCTSNSLQSLRYPRCSVFVGRLARARAQASKSAEALPGLFISMPSSGSSSSSGGGDGVAKEDSVTSSSPSAPLPSFLAEGTRVKILGLKSRQDLNGMHGEIIGNEGGDRCPVKVCHADGSTENVMVRSRNLVELVEMPEGYGEWQLAGGSKNAGRATEDQPSATSSSPPCNSTVVAKPRFHSDQPLVQQVLAQRKRLLELTKLRQLSMADVADHQIFLSAIEEHLVGRREDISRRWRATEAMQHSSGMSGSRRQQLESRREGIRRAEAQFNQELRIFNRERAWFHAQAAFKQARAHALETFKEDGAGNWCAYSRTCARLRCAAVSEITMIHLSTPRTPLVLSPCDVARTYCLVFGTGTIRGS